MAAQKLSVVKDTSLFTVILTSSKVNQGNFICGAIPYLDFLCYIMRRVFVESASMWPSYWYLLGITLGHSICGAETQSQNCPTCKITTGLPYFFSDDLKTMMAVVLTNINNRLTVPTYYTCTGQHGKGLYRDQRVDHKTVDPIHQNDLLVSYFYSYSSYSTNLAVH